MNGKSFYNFNSAWRSLKCALLPFAVACLLSACGTTRAADALPAQHEEAAAIRQIAVYPDPLLGHWMPADMACASPVNYDSDSLVVIEAGHLSRYEDGNKPMRVRKISESPQAWSIESLLNIGGDGYDTSVSEVFALSGRSLVIVGKDGLETYHRCD